MRFLLFLILIWMQYNCCSAAVCVSDEEVAFPAGAKTCKTDSSCGTYKTYNFGQGGVRCAKEFGGSDVDGVCCFKRSYCQNIRSGSDTMIVPDGNIEKVQLCKTHGECDNAKKQHNLAKDYQCEKDVCCTTATVDTVKACPMSEGQAEKPTQASCSITGAQCGKDEYCGIRGCCKIRLCEGSHMLPQHNISSPEHLQFLECTNNQQCLTAHRDFPDSYCSKVSGGDESRKFCCPVPFSRLFREKDNRLLLQAKVLKYHQSIEKPGEIAAHLSGEEGEYSKKCETNSDCGDDEFCDIIVPRQKSTEKILEKMVDYQPKACFPSLRCAGIPARDNTSTGIQFCEGTSGCGPQDFCDSQTNAGTDGVNAMQALGVCCHYDCKTEAINTGKIADENIPAYAAYTAQGKLCNYDSDCGDNGLCMTAKDVITNQNPLVLQGKEQKLCCSFETRKDDELYRCLIGVALRDTNQKIIKCATDEDCNREEGIELRDKSEWKYECVQSLSKEKHCCLAPHCGDELTFMRTELDCKTPQDCMRDEEDKSNAVGRAVCADFTERNQAAKKKKCCPIADARARLAYCTKRNCSSLADCDAVLAYCHPTKHVCCHAGITRLDGTKHESSGTCQGFCKDKQMFGKKVAQYCVAVKTSNAGVGECYLSPYVRIVDRDRAVNPVYKTVFIISVILTLVFAFLAVIMFVNYRSKNFCDKYTPKKKKGKKGKKKGKESGKSGTSGGGEGGTEGGGTSGASGVSGTGADGTSGAGDGTSGAGTGAGDGASGTGA